MPLSPRHESFAQALAAGATRKDAYLGAGYKTSQRNARHCGARLASRPAIRNRVKELLAEQLRALFGWSSAFEELAKEPLPNPTWERFAQYRAAGATKTDAYCAARRQATRKNASAAASKLAKQQCVKDRVSALQAAHARLLHGTDEKHTAPAIAPLENAQWELYTQHRAAGANQSAAYRAAGFKCTKVSASSCAAQLAKRAAIDLRVKELQRERLRILNGWEAGAAALAAPLLDNARWETFAQVHAAGAAQTDAYIAAGYKAERMSAWSGAAELARRDCIRARVLTLQTEHWMFLRERFKQQAIEILEAAMADGAYAIASRTLERLAKICGFWSD